MKIETKFDINDIVYCIHQDISNVKSNEHSGYDCQTKLVVRKGKVDQIRIDYTGMLSISYVVFTNNGYLRHMVYENKLFATREEAEKKLAELKGEGE